MLSPRKCNSWMITHNTYIYRYKVRNYIAHLCVECICIYSAYQFHIVYYRVLLVWKKWFLCRPTISQDTGITVLHSDLNGDSTWILWSPRYPQMLCIPCINMFLLLGRFLIASELFVWLNSSLSNHLCIFIGLYLCSIYSWTNNIYVLKLFIFAAQQTDSYPEDHIVPWF